MLTLIPSCWKNLFFSEYILRREGEHGKGHCSWTQPAMVSLQLTQGAMIQRLPAVRNLQSEQQQKERGLGIWGGKRRNHHWKGLEAHIYITDRAEETWGRRNLPRDTYRRTELQNTLKIRSKRLTLTGKKSRERWIFEEKVGDEHEIFVGFLDVWLVVVTWGGGVGFWVFLRKKRMAFVVCWNNGIHL